jgi:hypothetical protein
MRIIVSFNGGGLTINFENILTITNDCDHILLNGGAIHIVVNGIVICITSLVEIRKSWLLTANEVYFDTRIEEDE